MENLEHNPRTVVVRRPLRGRWSRATGATRNGVETHLPHSASDEGLSWSQVLTCVQTLTAWFDVHTRRRELYVPTATPPPENLCVWEGGDFAEAPGLYVVNFVAYLKHLSFHRRWVTDKGEDSRRYDAW